MKTESFEVIIIGGSYAGLSAGMSLGRAMRKILIIDGGKPCNRRTPFSHNFITQDGEKPAEIATKAKKQVLKYPTVTFLEDQVTEASKSDNGFELQTTKGNSFLAKKLIFTTGVIDIMPDIEGFGECWGVSVLHCPYCHGYEYKNQPTGLLGNGEMGFEFSKIITHWTDDLTLFTNGPSTLTDGQKGILTENGVKIVEGEIQRFEHKEGYLQHLILRDGTTHTIKAMYAKPDIKQQSGLPEKLGCNLNEHGLLEVDLFQKTNVKDIYAAGDNSTVGRSVAVATAAGSVAGMMMNKEMIEAGFPMVSG